MKINKIFNYQIIISAVFVLFLFTEIVYRTTWFTSHGQSDFIHILWFCRIVMLCYLIFFLVKNFSFYYLLVSLLLLIVSFFIYKNSHNLFLYDLFLFPLFITKCINKIKVYHLVFYTYLTSIFVTILLHTIGVLPHFDFFRENTVRYSLGFIHPNSLGLMCVLVAMLFFLIIRKITVFNLLFFVFLSLFCYLIPNSISASFLIFLLLILNVFCNYIHLEDYSVGKKNILFLSICFFIFFLFFVVLLIGTTGYGEGVIKFFPGELWARFSMGNDAFHKYGLSLWGKQDILNSTIVDSAYYFLILVKGIIPTFIYVLFFILAVKKCIDKNDTRLLLIQLVVLIYGLSECVICFPELMFAFFSLSNLSNEKKEEVSINE